MGTLRAPFDQTSPQLAQLSAVLERAGCVDRFALPPLDRDDIDELLKRMRVAPREALVRRLEELTAGNPLLLAELLSSGPPERVVNEWSSPPRVRDLVRRRTAELGRATSDILKDAALFEHDFTVQLLAEAAGTSPGTAGALIDRAVEAHVLHPSTIRSYRFAHQMFRHALVADLTPTQRAAGHRRIALALERCQPTPALLAAHWSAASGADVGPKVFGYARVAGREALRVLEPSAAVRWFDLALVYLTDEADRGSLLAELAEALLFAGDPACVATLQQSVDIALAGQDDTLTLQIVRTTTPGWSSLPGVTSAATQALLARALEIADDLPTRSRILARIAVDVSLRDAAEAERVAAESVTLARESGDRTALLESLMRSASLSLTPHNLPSRRDALREVLELSSRATDAATRYFALSASVVAAIQAGDRAVADSCSAEADAIAAHYALAPLRWSAMARHAWRAGLAGRLDRAEELIHRAEEYGATHGITHAPESARIQRATLRWQQGRIAELIPVARAAHDDYGAAFPGMTLVLARALAAEPAAHDEARAHLASVAENGFARLPRGTFWSTALVIAAETARIVELDDVSATIRDLLLPFADQVAFSGVWVAAPIAYAVGVACAGCRDPRARSSSSRPNRSPPGSTLPSSSHVRARASRRWLRTDPTNSSAHLLERPQRRSESALLTPPSAKEPYAVVSVVVSVLDDEALDPGQEQCAQDAVQVVVVHRHPSRFVVGVGQQVDRRSVVPVVGEVASGLGEVPCVSEEHELHADEPVRREERNQVVEKRVAARGRDVLEHDQ